MTKMTKKKGAPKQKFQIVNEYGERYRFDTKSIASLPDEMRGVYVLYDWRHLPVYIGEAGEKGRGRIKGRLRGHLRNHEYREVVKTFSVYGMRREYVQDVEALLLRTCDHVLEFNKYRGGFYKVKRLKALKGTLVRYKRKQRKTTRRSQ